MPTTTPSHDRTWTPVEGIPAPRADGAGAGAVSAVERTIPLPARSVPVQAASARAVATRAAVLQVVDAENPPLRIFFGDGPLAIATRDYESRLATWREWQPLAERAQGN